MTGYTVHTGSTVKFSNSWDRIFSKTSGSSKGENTAGKGVKAVSKKAAPAAGVKGAKKAPKAAVKKAAAKSAKKGK